MRLLLLFCLLTAPLSAIPEKLEVNLIEPTFKNGALTTTKGGVIQGENFFLQARNIEYIRKQEAGKPVHKIVADGDLFFLFNGRAYTGKKIEIDSTTKKTVITKGCTMVDPWYVGGEKIDLKPDGSGIIHNGYMTTSENEANDWSVESPTVILSKNATIKAKNVRFLFVRLPLLWLPTFSTDLKHSHSSPFKYRFRWGGKLGPRVGLSYDLIRSRGFKTEVLLDVVTRKGVGGGFTTHFVSSNGIQKFNTYNYIAHDIVGEREHKELRYRFRGDYENRFFERLAFKMTYDKLSDLEMRSDYMNEGLDSTKVLPTQARFEHKNEEWISSLNAKARVNQFQTVKEELPLFQFNSRPVSFGQSGFILNNTFSAGYLDYKYANQTPHVHDFNSSRIELTQKLYRHTLLGPVSVTPYIGYTLIHYNRSPKGGSKLVAVGKGGAEVHTRFVHPLDRGVAHLEPYLQYDYFSTPRVGPKQHYIFDMQDGWHRLNMLRFGIRNTILRSTDENFIQRFRADIYGRAFFDTPTIVRTIPRIYGDFSFKANPYSAYFLQTAWDTRHHYLDHFNIKSDFTISEDIAFTLEYRHRSSFAWRKLDPENFMIDSFRSESLLRHSQMSDRRDTVLAGLFCRLSPALALDLKTRHGFGRRHQPAYNIYELDVITLIRGALQLTISTEKRNKEWRWGIDVSLGPDKPRPSPTIRRIGQGNYDN